MISTPESSGRELLRHTLATLAYRGRKPLRDAPADFVNFRIAPGSRTPGEILAHVCDLLDWAGWLARGEQKWANSKPGAWSDDVARFFAGLKALDDYLASSAPLQATVEALFQGPIADALTHVGQLTMLRRLSGHPIKGENYHRADIARGRVGEDQSPPRIEFD